MIYLKIIYIYIVLLTKIFFNKKIIYYICIYGGKKTKSLSIKPNSISLNTFKNYYLKFRKYQIFKYEIHNNILNRNYKYFTRSFIIKLFNFFTFIYNK